MDEKQRTHQPYRSYNYGFTNNSSPNFQTSHQSALDSNTNSNTTQFKTVKIEFKTQPNKLVQSNDLVEEIESLQFARLNLEKDQQRERERVKEKPTDHWTEHFRVKDHDRLEQQKRDEVLAQEIAEEEWKFILQKQQQEEKDQEIAKNLEQEEKRKQLLQEQEIRDRNFAKLLEQQENQILEKERQKREQIEKDQRIAREIHEQEKKKTTCKISVTLSLITLINLETTCSLSTLYFTITSTFTTSSSSFFSQTCYT